MMLVLNEPHNPLSEAMTSTMTRRSPRRASSGCFDTSARAASDDSTSSIFSA
jgi:hypothetical protein